MMFEERVRAVAQFGFTERQARFLVTVILHAGVCLPRQFAAFAGIAYGQKTGVFFRKLVAGRYASACDCLHNRARLYHIHHRGLYGAIGEPDSAHRRVSASRVMERVMLLDAILGCPELTWLSTEQDKVGYFTQTMTVPLDRLPRVELTSGSSTVARYFPDRLPIGIDPTGRAVFLYLATGPCGDDFRAVLERCGALLRAAPTWTFRLVFPQPLEGCYAAYQQIVREELESPLHPTTLNELRSRFERQRTAGTNGTSFLAGGHTDATQTFDGGRFRALYRRWLRQGDTALEAASSPVIADALDDGAARIECHILPYEYSHLSPLVDVSGNRRRGSRRGNIEGNRRPHALDPSGISQKEALSTP